jgi:hypothetical protein
MNPHIPESVSAWWVIMGDMMPPRDPIDDDDEDEPIQSKTARYLGFNQ